MITLESDCRLTGVIVHRTKFLPRIDTTTIEGIRVTTPTRTIIDLPAVCEPSLVEGALDDALRRGLTSIAHLRRRLEAIGGSGRPGSKMLRELIAERDSMLAGPQSPLESEFLGFLKRQGFPTPVCQHPVLIDGRLVAVLDFAYPERMIAIETDGFQHHSDRDAWENDNIRDQKLAEAGWTILRVTSRQLRNRPAVVAARIQKALG